MEVVSNTVSDAVQRIGRPRSSVGEWIEYEFSTNDALRSGDTLVLKGPPYRYPLIASQRSDYMVIAASERFIVDMLLSGLWQHLSLRKCGIRTHTLVLAIMDKKFKMQEGTGAMLVPCLAYLYAKTTGYEPTVEWASFQGRDLSVAKMVTEHRDKVVFSRCGIRIPGEKYERAKLSQDGGIDFHANALHGGATKDESHLDELVMILKAAGYTEKSVS